VGTYRHRLSFGAEHDSADLGKLPAQLGMPARFLWRRGEPRIAPNGRVIGGDRRNSHCSFDLGEGGDLPRSLREALARPVPHKMVLEELSASGVALRFFIGWFSDDLNSGVRLDWELLRDTAALKIALDFDFYGPEEKGQAGP
jgi:hypothetical protein